MSRSSSFFRSHRHSTQLTSSRSNNRRENGTPQPEVSPSFPPEPMRRSRSSGLLPQPNSVEPSRHDRRRRLEEGFFPFHRSRPQTLNPPVDLRLLDYVTAYDGNLMCPICRCPFVDPVILNECDHCFCRDCIRQTWTNAPNNVYNPLGPRGECPTCRTPAKLGPRSATSKILVNILDDLMVKCPKTDEGCTAQIKRGEAQDHVSIYCGYALVECSADDCELPVRRKDLPQGCMHYDVSCIACRKLMQKSNLENHWRGECRDRKIACSHCNSEVFYRELEEHNERTCPAASIPCPGKSMGCEFQTNKRQAESHAKACLFAKLAPVFNAQKQRLDEQESAQKQMSRKLEILETGVSAMHSILNPELQNSSSSNNEDLVPTPQTDDSEALEVDEMDDDAGYLGNTNDLEYPHTDSPAFIPAPNQSLARATPSTSSRRAPHASDPRAVDVSQPFNTDFDVPSLFPPPTANGPYTSPLHHLLSMHENLREEMSRMNSALQELDGRHSMQILNENLRTREEITYIGAQVAGLSRQVHWLTSVQLQRQSRSDTSGAVGSSDLTAAGSSVEAAVSAVNSAVRGAARMVNGSRESAGMRRRSSEEGRTKL